MLDHKKIEDDLIDRYLRKQLNSEELAQFELRMLEDLQFTLAVQKAEQMQKAFKSHARQLQLRSEEDAAVSAKVRPLPFGQWIKQPLSLAASVLLGIGIVLMGNQYLLQGSSDFGGDYVGIDKGYAISSVVNLSATRSAQGEITIPAGVHLLQVDVGIGLTNPLYTLTLAPDDGGQPYEFSVVPDSNGIVRILTPSGLNGFYKLTVQDMARTESEESFSLRFN